MKVRYRLEDLGVDERKISKYLFKETGFEGVDWINWCWTVTSVVLLTRQ
jgi:hypothetical protein